MCNSILGLRSTYCSSDDKVCIAYGQHLEAIVLLQQYLTVIRPNRSKYAKSSVKPQHEESNHDRKTCVDSMSRLIRNRRRINKVRLNTRRRRQRGVRRQHLWRNLRRIHRYREVMSAEDADTKQKEDECEVEDSNALTTTYL
jgi:hypothetical protein